MALDPNIALGYRGIEVPNPLNQFAQAQQLQANELKMQETMAANQERNALRRLDPAAADYENQLFKVNPQLGIQFRKERTASEASQAMAAQHKAEAATKRAAFAAQGERDLARDPSDTNITRWLTATQASDLFTPQEKAQAQAQAESYLSMPVAKRAAAMQMTGASPSDYASQERVGLERQRVGLEGQRVGLEGKRVKLAEDEAQIKRQGIEGVSPKELQKREAALPAATAAIKGFETKSDSFVKDLEKLRDHPGLSQITGIAAGRLPAVTADGRAAQALYDKIVAKGGFQALQDLRDASKTGGALGNVSNQEGRQLSSSFAAIQRTQDAPDVKAAIDQAIGDIQGSKTRMREAYDSTYSYKRAPTGSNEIDFGSLK